MKIPFSPSVASTSFIAVYTAVYALKRPLATYLPVEGVWRLGRAAGAYPMYWYGYVAAATVASVAAGFVLPEPRQSRVWSAITPLLAALAVAFVAARELRLF